MDLSQDHVTQLRDQIASVEKQLDDLKVLLARAEDGGFQEQPFKIEKEGPHEPPSNHPSTYRWPLEMSEYHRYGRQLIMPEIGLEGQLSLKRSRVLIVGLGGLGCPAATYLAGAGVGSLGLVDDDRISLSNLHRQTLYTERNVGGGKAENAARTLKPRNSNVKYQIFDIRLTPSKALELFADYDLIVDCTDHPSSRYFISDAAVLTNTPLISASALRTEGQLMVLNNPPNRQETRSEGFCYRCVFPKPPPPESITTCGEGGILGPVVGVMGVLMAMEAIKVLTTPSIFTEETAFPSSETNPSLLLYSAYSNPPFRTVRLKGKRADCIACSEHATITKESLTSGSVDYVAFCGIAHAPSSLPDSERISPQGYAELQKNPTQPHYLIDVREPVEFDIAHIENSINLPFSLITRDLDASLTTLQKNIGPQSSTEHRPQLHFICKLGNDSQVAVAKIRDAPRFKDYRVWECKGDIKGGLWQWREQVDPSFPDYGGFPSSASESGS